MIRLTHGLCLLICLATVAPVASADELRRTADWETPDPDSVWQQFDQWLERQPVTEAKIQRAHAMRTQAELAGRPLLDVLVESAAVVDERVAEVVFHCRQPFQASALPDFAALEPDALPSWLAANLRLYYARWLADALLFDEVEQVLAGIPPSDVCDPAALLFHQAIAHHRQLEKEQCLELLGRLLANEQELPIRYITVARLMMADIEPLKPDSLDEISRLMDNVKTRLRQARAGTRVREEEDAIVEKLDKLIKQLEEQAAAAMAQAAAQGGAAPAAPMNDSMPGGGSGPGNVDPRKLGDRTDWGNLPPKEREAALQRLGKDLPSHYRDVVEEYFRKLARDGSESEATP